MSNKYNPGNNPMWETENCPDCGHIDDHTIDGGCQHQGCNCNLIHGNIKYIDGKPVRCKPNPASPKLMDIDCPAFCMHPEKML
jgi:hypothetical protein